MLKVGLIGCGAIGAVIAQAIETRLAERYILKAVFDLSIEKAKVLVKRLKISPFIASDFLNFMKEDLDLVIEAASQEAVVAYAEKILKANRDLMIMSVGALLKNDLFEKLSKVAYRYKRHIYLPSGAVAGIDALKAAALAGLKEVVLTTRKPPLGLKGAPYIKEKGIKLEDISTPTLIYEGPAEEAVKYFPANVNVAAIVSLVGLGKIKTKVRIIVDPNLHTNQHEIKAKGIFGELTCLTDNVPCPDNPKTSYLAALSAIKTLEKISEEIVIGT
ncbi:MAG: aspartate dehydrogenase [Candidatus Desulfofervidus auxilii]|nr:aspartate dehydrogenase [Candidatus Desulfofervidus auxilii]